MSLAPSCSITLGDLRYDGHALELLVTLSVLPGVNSFRVDLPVTTTVTCQPGDPARLDVNGGDGQTTVLAGTVRSVSRSLSRVRVTAADAGADLASVRPVITVTGQSGADVIARLAEEAGVTVGDHDFDLPLGAYTTQQGRTASEHVAYLAGLGGAVAMVDADNTLAVRARPSGPADQALLYGRELVECEVRDYPVRAARVPIGNGPSGQADAPDALRPTAGPLPEEAAAPGRDARWVAAPVLRTPKVAVAAGEAYAKAQGGAARRLRARGFLLPALRPGMAIEIQELPGSIADGAWLLTRVVHRLRPHDAGTTTLEGESLAPPAGMPGLLASAVAAVGSLL
jgi:hypothetical protein